MENISEEIIKKMNGLAKNISESFDRMQEWLDTSTDRLTEIRDMLTNEDE